MPTTLTGDRWWHTGVVWVTTLPNEAMRSADCVSFPQENVASDTIPIDRQVNGLISIAFVPRLFVNLGQILVMRALEGYPLCNTMIIVNHTAKFVTCGVIGNKSCNDFDTSSFSEGLKTNMNWIVGCPRLLGRGSEMVYNSLKLLFGSIFDKDIVGDTY